MTSHGAEAPYAENDIYVDPIPLTDSWGQFLSMRFGERKTFYDELDEPGRQLISKELMRIKHFRDLYQKHFLSTADSDPLAALLERARADWNSIAFHRCHGELAKKQGIVAEERNCRILRAVQRRGGYPGADGPDLVPSGTDGNLANYNPAEGDYGYNGWLMVFEDGRRGINDDRCYGQFPHQKISIRQLLYNKEKTPLRRSEDKSKLRLFHIPANNMAWVEVKGSQLHTTVWV